MIRIHSFRYEAVEIDLGEMFLKFPIHKQLHNSVGIDLTPFSQQLSHAGVCPVSTSGKIIAAKWTRLRFGLNQSPEYSVTFYYLAKIFIKGNNLDVRISLCWDKMILNLIGNNDFDPTYPNMYKWYSHKNRIARY